MELNGETIKIIGKELPWLPALLWKDSGKFKVQVLDLDALSLTVNDYDFCRIHLVSKDGKKIGEVSREMKTRRLWWPFSSLAKMTGEPTSIEEEKYFSETLEGALNRLRPESEKLQFVLYVEGYRVTLYKVPKGTNFIEHMERKKAEVDAEIVSFLKEH